MDSYSSPTTKPLFRGTQIVWYVLGVIEVLLLFRFSLKLLGANTAATFTAFIYGLSNAFVGPFENVFRISPVVQGSMFEWTTLLAMLAYWVLAVGLVELLLMGREISTPEAAVKLNAQETN